MSGHKQKEKEDSELKIVREDTELNAFSHCNPSKFGNTDFGLGSSSQHTMYN